MQQPELVGVLAAVGIGVLIGVVRERTRQERPELIAGVRTHLVVAAGGTLAMLLGTGIFIAYLLAIGALAAASYWRTAHGDPGMTSEVTLLATALLAAGAQESPQLASGLAVVVAGALYAKRPLHRFANERLREQELQDALLLAAAALIVLPLLPDEPVDPWKALVPAKIWRLVVLILAVGMAGHVAMRIAGARWGLAMAGFFSGFASSTAAIAGFGHSARAEPAHTAHAASAALLANLASLLLFIGVIGAASPGLLALTALPLAACAAVTLAVAGVLSWRAKPVDAAPDEPPPRSFKLRQGLLLGALMAALTLLSGWLRESYGESGVVIAAMAVAIAELHAAAASLGQLHAGGGLSASHGQNAVLGLLATSGVAKCVLAFASGGRGFGLRVAFGLLAALGAAVLVVLLA